MNKKVFSWRLNDKISVSILSSVGNWFKARDLAAENARSSSLSFVCGTMTSCWQNDSKICQGLKEVVDDVPEVDRCLFIDGDM